MRVLTQTADTIRTHQTDQTPASEELKTIVEHLGYQDCSRQEQQF